MVLRNRPRNSKILILTIGHSTRPIAEFIELLRANAVELLVDIRTIPRSRHNPQFNEGALSESLKGAGIGYARLKELGGLRHAAKDSQNTGWRNESFRGFADYMQTPEFESGIAKLLALAANGQTAIMCAEAVPWRCHRSLIADALAARGVRVEHITGPGPAGRKPHKMTPFARVDGMRITYPAAGV